MSTMKKKKHWKNTSAPGTARLFMDKVNTVVKQTGRDRFYYDFQLYRKQRECPILKRIDGEDLK
jgi:hypothetical protein